MRPKSKDTAADWSNALQSLDVAGIEPVFDELAGHERRGPRVGGGSATRPARTSGFCLTPASCRRGSTYWRLPEPGEAFHLVTAKRYSLWNVVQAVLQLAEPATINYLGIATLGFSKQNLEELLADLDSSRIGRVDFLFSVYFKSNEKEICQRLAHELTTRGHRVVAMLTHAKVMLLELTDGRQLVVESSANLRSCSSVEQIMFANDTALFAFHPAMAFYRTGEPEMSNSPEHLDAQPAQSGPRSTPSSRPAASSIRAPSMRWPAMPARGAAMAYG